VTRFEEAFEQYEKRRLTGEEAGELLGMSGRNFRRLCVRYEEDGIEGLRDRRIGKVSPRRAPQRELERMHELYRERYSDFTVKHFHEQLVKRHDYKLCYTVTRLSLQAAGLAAKARRRGAHRKRRLRRPLPGMLLFQDGSTHRWIAALGRDLDLIVTLDDATGAIYSAFLVEQEGTMSSFLGLAETIGRHGLFGAFYTDRGGHYFITPKDAGKVDKTQLTQVGRALSQLGITHIPSYSPQARGRMERVFGTLQNRLPQELRQGRDQDRAGRQSVPQGPLRARLQCPFRGAGGRARLGVRALCRPADRGRALRPGGSRGRRRQLRLLAPAQPPDSAPAPSPSLRPRHPARAPISRRAARHLRRAALSCPLRPERTSRRCRLSSRLNPLGGREACGFVDNASALPTSPTGPTTAKEADN
jgi:hypothetical protein